MDSFAIVVIGYNRLKGLKRLVESLNLVDFEGRKDITLIFSIDFSPTNFDVVEFAKLYSWKHGTKELIIYSENQGLKKHILNCGKLTERFDIVVLLEDDLFVSNSMYKFAYYSMVKYKNDDNVAGISLYNFNSHWLNNIYKFNPQKNKFDAYFLKIAQSWGQVWNYNKFMLFYEWYKINKIYNTNETYPFPLNKWDSDSSWLKFFNKYCIEKNKYYVYPYYSISTNFSDSGTNNKKNNNDSQVVMQSDTQKLCFPDFEYNSVIYDEFMERENIGRFLQIDDNNLTVNLYNLKSEKLYKRYLLTTKKLDYKIIDEYRLCLRPIESSIVNKIKGEGIFLYDTTIREKNKSKYTKIPLAKFYLNSSSIRRSLNLVKMSFKILFYEFLEKTKR